MNLQSKNLINQIETKTQHFEFKYSPYPLEKALNVCALAHTFERTKTDVIDYIFKKNRGNLQSFADAFKLKKD